MKLLVVDGNSIVNRAYYGVKALTTKNGDFTNGIYGFLMILRRMLDEVRPNYVAVAFDMRTPTFRHELFEGYKAQRKRMPTELASQMRPLKDLLKALGYQIVSCEGYEADDILGTLAAACREEGVECVVATGDRDSFQLIGDGVTVRLASTQRGQAVTTSMDANAIREKYGVEPGQLVDVKALMGDPSDNIPGVAGIGEKTALGLIAKYGTLDGVYEHLDDVSPVVRGKLEAGKDTAYLCQKLARINCEAPVDTRLESYQVRPVNQPAAAGIFARLEMFRMQEKWGVDPTAFAGSRAAQAKAGREEKSESVATEPITVDPVAKLDAYLSHECICLFQRRELDGAGFMALVQRDHVLFLVKPEDVNKVLGYGKLLRVWSGKAVYKYAFDEGEPMDLVQFDGELAAYLLSPSSAKYQMRDLAAQYGVPARQVDGPIPWECVNLVEDVQVVWELFRSLEQEVQDKELMSLFHDIEIPLARVLASMEREGFALDAPALEAYGEELSGRLQEIREQVYEMAGESFNLNSPRQLGRILFEKLELPAKKKTKTGYSTDAEVLDELRTVHPIVNLILENRQLAKLKSTYVEGLLKEVDPDGRVRTTFQQTETRTGRISSIDPNLQNIPVRTPEGSKLRKFFHAKPGFLLVDADYSQIELRVLAHMAKDENMCRAFRENDDIHAITASQVFNMPLEMVTPAMRSRAKAVNFGIVYGISAFSLSQDIGVSVAEADSYIKGYLDTYAGVKNYMDETIAFAKDNGYVKTMFGRRRNLPELAAAKKSMRAFGERVAMNMPIQGTAADIIKIAMIRVYDRLTAEGMRSKLILQVHDELLVEAPEDEAEKAAQVLREEMERAVTLSVPLVAETHAARTWLEAK